MCKVINIEKEIKDDDIDFIYEKADELGLRVFVSNFGVMVEGYNKSCFCNVGEGWRQAVSTLIKELIGDNYYIYFRSGINSDMIIIEGDIPQDKKELIKNSKVKLKLLNKAPKQGDEDGLKEIRDAIVGYQDALARYDTGTIEEVRF